MKTRAGAQTVAEMWPRYILWLVETAAIQPDEQLTGIRRVDACFQYVSDTGGQKKKKTELFRRSVLLPRDVTSPAAVFASKSKRCVMSQPEGFITQMFCL